MSNLKGQMTEVSVTMGVDTSLHAVGYFAGVSFVDFNQDGWDDLTFSTQSGDSILFYENNQGSNFNLIPSLVEHVDNSSQVLWIDTDNDGDLDLFVSTTLGQNRFYENTGSLTLIDRTSTCGLLIQNDESLGANFGDYDNDGDLDLFVSNYDSGSFSNTFYRNDGSNTFVDITSTIGINTSSEHDFCSAFIDIDNDMDLDLYTILDKQFSNKLFENDGSGSYNDISVASGAGITIDAMNAGVGDYNGDGYLDIYITNTDAGSALLKNNGNSTFTDVADAAGVKLVSGVHWGGNWVDIDNDKDLDLYVSSMFETIPHSNALFENQNDGTFIKTPANGLPGDTLQSFANAVGDFNNDGWYDIVVLNGNSQNVQLWKNTIAGTNNYIKVKLEGIASNSQGIGSWLELYSNGEKFVRFTHTAEAYLAQNSLKTHFGLGSEGYVDSLLIKWPSGTVDSYYCLDVNTLYVATEGVGIVDQNDLLRTNKWIGGSGDCTVVANWSLGHLPTSEETVIMQSLSNSTITITNPLINDVDAQEIIVENNVTFINNGTMSIEANGGNGITLNPGASFINNATLEIMDVCKIGIESEDDFQNFGTITIGGDIGEEAIRIKNGGLIHSKPGGIINLD